VVTHVPGLIYLVALNGIAADHPRPTAAAIEVLLYNALWFAIPFAAFALATLRPGRGPEYLDRGMAWAREHEQVLVVVTFALLGVYLIVKGLVQLF